MLNKIKEVLFLTSNNPKKKKREREREDIIKLNSTYMQWFNWIQIFCDLAEFLR